MQRGQVLIADVGQLPLWHWSTPMQLETSGTAVECFTWRTQVVVRKACGLCVAGRPREEALQVSAVRGWGTAKSPGRAQH